MFGPSGWFRPYWLAPLNVASRNYSPISLPKNRLNLDLLLNPKYPDPSIAVRDFEDKYTLRKTGS